MFSRVKILIIGMLISSLFGYLEWGTGSSSFLIEAEWNVLSKIFIDPASVAHPFTLIPLFGQLLLIVSLFQDPTRRLLVYSGIASLGLLLCFMLIVGMLAANPKIIISTMPFFILAWFVIRSIRQSNQG